MINLIILSLIFSPLLFLFFLLIKKRAVLTTNRVIPGVISAVFILYKGAQMSSYSAGGGDFKGFVFLSLPIIGFLAIGISYLLWNGYLFLIANWHNKEQVPKNFIVTTLMIGCLATGLYYDDYVFYWPRANPHPSKVRNLFWDGVLSGIIPAKAVQWRAQAYSINGFEKQYLELALHKDPDVGDKVLATLADVFKDDQQIPRYLTKNRYASEALLKMFADSPNESFLLGIAQNVNAPPDLLVKLYKNKPDVVMSRLATNSATPAEILIEILKDGSSKIANEIADSNASVVNIEDKTSPYNKVAQIYQIRSRTPGFGPATNAIYGAHKHFYSVDELAATCRELMQDPRENVRMWVAASNYTSPESLAIMVDDPSTQVINLLIMNESTPSEAKKKAVKRLAKSVK